MHPIYLASPNPRAATTRLVCRSPVQEYEVGALQAEQPTWEGGFRTGVLWGFACEIFGGRGGKTELEPLRPQSTDR